MITTSTTVITMVISITAAIIPPIIGPLSDLVVGLSFNAGVGEMSFNDEVGEILIGHSLVIKTVDGACIETVDGACIECGSSTIETDNMCILVYWVLIHQPISKCMSGFGRKVELSFISCRSSGAIFTNFNSIPALL